MPSGAVKAFTNIKEESLSPFCTPNELKPYEASKPAPLEAGHSFEDCMDMGGVITDAHSVSWNNSVHTRHA